MKAHAVRMLLISALLALTAVSTAALRPSEKKLVAAPDLGAYLPDEFAGWRRIELSNVVLPPESDIGPGEAVAYRAYADDLGRVVTLVAAYGPPLGDSVRLHRPEKCYAAQGFDIVVKRQGAIDVAHNEIPIVELEAEAATRREAVSYVLRDGATYSKGFNDAGWRRLIELDARRDGALLRVSSVYADAPPFALQRRFVEDLIGAMPEDGRKLFLAGNADDE